MHNWHYIPLNFSHFCKKRAKLGNREKVNERLFNKEELFSFCIYIYFVICICFFSTFFHFFFPFFFFSLHNYQILIVFLQYDNDDNILKRIRTLTFNQHSSRQECMDNCDIPKSTVRIPVIVDMIDPIVDPHGQSFLTTNSCIGIGVFLVAVFVMGLTSINKLYRFG